MRVGQLGEGLSEVETILRSLDFANNFGGKEAKVDIDAGAEIAFVNPFNPRIPARYILLDVQLRTSGTVSISRGTSAAWTASQITLKNSGTANATVIVLFLLA